MPVSVRIEGDTRANSLDRATIRIEPTGVVDDLTGLREATKAAADVQLDLTLDRDEGLGFLSFFGGKHVGNLFFVANMAIIWEDLQGKCGELFF